MVFLMRMIRNWDGRYIEYTFFLYKGQYSIKFHINELSAIDTEGEMTSKHKNLDKRTYQINLLKLWDNRQLMMDSLNP